MLKILKRMGSAVASAVNVTISALTGATYTDMQSALRTFGHAGIISGGIITDAGGATVDISAGQGFIRSTNSGFGELFSCDWSASAGVVIPSDTTKYIAIEYNAGTPQILVSATNNFDHHTQFRLGSVVNEGGTLHVTVNPQKARDAGADMFHRIFETEPWQRAERIGGLILGELGTRNISLSAGELYDGLNEFDITTKDTSGSDTFDSYSAGGQESTGNTQWDNLQYDNAGTLATLGASKFAVHWFYIEADDVIVHVYGTSEYTSASLAQAESAPATLPDRLVVHGRLVGRLIFQKSAATASIIESAFDTAFTASAAAAHNDTSGIQGGAANDYFHMTAAEYAASHVTVSASDPTVNDDSGAGYVVGNPWINTTSDAVFVAADVTVGAAVWQDVSTGVWVGTAASDLDMSTYDVHFGHALGIKTRSGNATFNDKWSMRFAQVANAVTFFEQGNGATGDAPYMHAASLVDSNVNHRLSVQGVAAYELKNGGIELKRVSKSTDYTTTIGDYYTGVDTSGGAVTITLGSATALTDGEYIIKDESGDAGTNTLTIDTEGSETIDGAASQTITSNYGVFRIKANGTNFSII